MESPLVDDDICILKHETEYVVESPVAVCSGDESVASHFALVTAYEDIKKRLRDTERENTALRKRVKQLEDKLFRPEAPPSEGPQYMNKAFSAYRGIYMEKKDLQAELNKLKKEWAESERHLMDQLQAKELEVLQLKSELETSQVMKSLNETQDYWQVKRGSTELQIHTLQEELDRLRVENSHLHTLCGATQEAGERAALQSEGSGELAAAAAAAADSRTVFVMKTYEEVFAEMKHLHTLVTAQSQLMRKIRDKPLPPQLRRAASALPVQCLDDVECKRSPVHVSVPRPPSAPPAPCSSTAAAYSESPKDSWPLDRPTPLGSAAGPPNLTPTPTPPQHPGSLEDGSWSIPAHPAPSHALFWEGPSPGGPTGHCWPKPF